MDSKNTTDPAQKEVHYAQVTSLLNNQSSIAKSQEVQSTERKEVDSSCFEQNSLVKNRQLLEVDDYNGCYFNQIEDLMRVENIPLGGKDVINEGTTDSIMIDELFLNATPQMLE